MNGFVEAGSELRNLRFKCRMSQTQFAMLLGIGGARLASYESGRVPWRPDLIAIARARLLEHLLTASKEANETFTRLNNHKCASCDGPEPQTPESDTAGACSTPKIAGTRQQ